MKIFVTGMIAIVAGMSAYAAKPVKYYSPADTSAVRIVGRTEASPQGDVKFDWSGVYAETTLDAPALSLRLSDTGRSYFDVSVDGKPAGKFKAAGTDTVVTVVDKLSKGPHKVLIRKRTEGETGMTTFHSFILPRGGSMTATSGRGRHIEFIGNSLSAGYGTDGNVPTDPFTPETESCNMAFSTIIPRYFDTDYTIIAHSGRGAVRNYGDSVRVSKGTMKHKFLQTFDEDPESSWDFTRYRPDMVVINLGSNDFSTEPHPYRSEFVGAYLEIIKTVFEKYGEDVKMICLMPYSISESVEDYFRDIVKDAASPNVHFIRMPVDYLNWDSDRGPSFHPNYTGQKKMSMLLIPYVSTIMGWPMTDKVVE